MPWLACVRRARPPRNLLAAPEARGYISLPAVRFRRGDALKFAFLIVAYYATAQIGYAFQFAGPVAAIVWLPVGVGIAGVYVLGFRFLPAVVLGDLLVNNYSALPVGAAVGQTFGNALEVIIAAALLLRLAGRAGPLVSVRGVVAMFIATCAGTAVSATIGTVSLSLAGVIAGGAFAHVWRTWWLGDFTGAMIVVPLALAFARGTSCPGLRCRPPEAAVVLAALVIPTLIAVKGGPPWSYLAFPALIWAALRFGPRGAAVAFAISAGLTIWATTHSLGPFALRSISHSLLDAQIYLAAAALTVFAVAALACEREQLAERVRASRRRIIAATDRERRRLERDLHDGAQGRLLALAVSLRLAADEAREAPESAAAAFQAAGADVQVAIEELRAIVHGVYPDALWRFGLASAVQSMTRLSGAPVELIELPQVRLDELAETAAYYLIFETVTNAQRHARASRVRVSASLTTSTLIVHVEDDGVGGAVEQDGGGLQGLRDRIESTGGRLDIDTQVGRGTRVTARIPARLRDNAPSARPGARGRPKRQS
ncbi:MAG TPA: MASE1 domain-containing protein [Solirubrobacteraceae bacterium]|nr:MASE1 domain-containing protein [Solirubrobacteraceae bacterium]